MSAINRNVSQRVASASDDGTRDLRSLVGGGNPPVLDPLAGFPNSPFFRRNLKFIQVQDGIGRIRLAAFTIGE